MHTVEGTESQHVDVMVFQGVAASQSADAPEHEPVSQSKEMAAGALQKPAEVVPQYALAT
jgi:hypothetical protein